MEINTYDVIFSDDSSMMITGKATDSLHANIHRVSSSPEH